MSTKKNSKIKKKVEIDIAAIPVIKKVADKGVMEKSRYYEDFKKWLNCCRINNPTDIEGTPFEQTLFKVFKSIMSSVDNLLKSPDMIEKIDFKHRGIDVYYHSSMKWKYPKGNLLIYDPDLVINSIKRADDF